MSTERIIEDSKPIRSSTLSVKAQGLELCECDGGSCLGDCGDCGSGSGDCTGVVDNCAGRVREKDRSLNK